MIETAEVVEVTAAPMQVAVQQLLDELRVVHDQVVRHPELGEPELTLVRDAHWHAAEARRILTTFRRRLEDRLAGSIPTQRSLHTSLHDPPDACPPERSSPP